MLIRIRQGGSRMAILKVNNLVKRFGGLVAVHDLDMTVNEGEMLGLIGPNGAGKTTLFNMVAGYYRLLKADFSECRLRM